MLQDYDIHPQSHRCKNNLKHIFTVIDEKVKKYIKNLDKYLDQNFGQNPQLIHGFEDSIDAR